MKDIFDATTLRVRKGEGGIELANRVWRSATWMAMAGGDGKVNDALVDVYREYAEGGADAFQQLLVDHPLISIVEVNAAFDLD